MVFDANKHIKIEGSQGEDDLFTLRTKGLAERKRPELEMIGLPEKALRAAGGVINKVADYTVNTAEVLADQNIALFLPREGDDEDAPALMLALHTSATEAPKKGLIAKLAGGNKGVLRLSDITGEVDEPPLTAIATMLVYRAAVRREGGDDDGARSELEAAIEIFPGEEDAGPAPTIGDGSDVFNWQNHLAYMALADLDEENASFNFRQAVGRSDVLSCAELGAPLRDVQKVELGELERVAAQIIAHNLAGDPRVDMPSPGPAHAVLKSPIWQPVEDGKIGRCATLVPARFRELYYEGPAAEGLRRAGARMAARAVFRKDACELAWSIRDVRGIWKDDHAPVVETIGARSPHHGLLSTVLVFIARCFRAGVDDERIEDALRHGGESELLDELAAQVEWETAQYAAAMSVGTA